MRLNFFSHHESPEPEQQSAPPQGVTAPAPPNGKTFPADEIVWGIVIRNGFDEMDDPWYHRGTTQHAYLEGNDSVAICGFRPPQSGPRSRRRSRLGMPSAGIHPMCGSCARLVVAPRPRVPVPVQASRPAVAVPVARPAGQPAPPVPAVPAATVATSVPAGAAPAPVPHAGAAPTSPWVAQRSAGDVPDPNREQAVDLGLSHDSGLLKRGVHADPLD